MVLVMTVECMAMVGETQGIPHHLPSASTTSSLLVTVHEYFIEEVTP